MSTGTLTARSGASSAARLVASLVVVVAMLAGLRWAVMPDHGSRNLEFFPDMALSPAVESQSPCAVLPGGLSQQPLVAGVVPRGRLPFGYGSSEDEAKRAGAELHSPFPPGDAAALERGAEVFRVHCTPCHDAGGGGRGKAVERGMLPPPSLLGASAVQMPEGQMYHLLTLGRGNMPPMRARVERDDRWRAILHVRKLQAEAAK